MKIHEVLKEGLAPTVSGKDVFVKTLINQIHDYIDSVRETKQPLSMFEFVESYLTQHGWTTTPQQENLLKIVSSEVDDEYNYFLKKSEKSAPQGAGPNALAKSGSTVEPVAEGVMGDLGQWAKAKAGTMAGSIASKMGLGSVTKLANAMYRIASTQQRDPRTGQVMQATRMKAQAQTDDATIDPQGQQIIKSLKSLKGPRYEKDLEEIIKLALWNLYGTDKQDYSELVKSITAKKSTAQQPTQNTQQQP